MTRAARPQVHGQIPDGERRDGEDGKEGDDGEGFTETGHVLDPLDEV